MSKTLEKRPRALLLVPPIYDFAAYDMYARPFALLRLGLWLKQGGYEVELLNSLDYTDASTAKFLGQIQRKSDGSGKFFRQIVAKPKALKDIPRYFARYGILSEVLQKRIADFRPDLVLISSGMTYWYLGVKEAVDLVKSHSPQAKVVLGGIYATLCPEHALKTCGPDSLVRGRALPELAQVLAKWGLPVPQGAIPVEGLLCPQGYLGAAAIRLNEGCPFSCSYCASSKVAGPFRPGQGRQLFNWIKRLHVKLGIRDYCFYDDALLAGPGEEFKSFLQEVITSGLRLRFHIPNGLHVALITEELAWLLKRAGVVDFKLGFESAAEDFHQTYDKKYRLKMFGEAIAKLRHGGFKPEEIAVYVLAGLPFQDPEEVETSIRFAAGFGVKVYVAEFSPIPGTEIWERCIAASRFPIAEEPLFHNNSIFPLQWEKFGPKEMHALKQLAYKLTRLAPLEC